NDTATTEDLLENCGVSRGFPRFRIAGVNVYRSCPGVLDAPRLPRYVIGSYGIIWSVSGGYTSTHQCCCDY
ncbi:MAG: hypothetical protein SV775_12565, partial [Thermodesulfobacteriota bacterium]|nr:hypothetical protein [Thermodesulfobacteriota bacterium]